ncbi:hypothetical protein K456DRAFT_78647 [Colletotrichum gloeosporioides 23]|nr:hypothetical protein K456DRAFT_78647 [Colletotrichum gloeosporioides 23]
MYACQMKTHLATYRLQVQYVSVKAVPLDIAYVMRVKTVEHPFHPHPHRSLLSYTYLFRPIPFVPITGTIKLVTMIFFPPVFKLVAP